MILFLTSVFMRIYTLTRLWMTNITYEIIILACFVASVLSVIGQGHL